ncbi:MAG: PilZ domain-containing protein [Acidobacteriaceae bacterium]
MKALFGQERRNAERRALPGLVAFYWDGANPVPRGIRDISSTGMYLLTEERWYLGTLVIMTLQNKDIAEADSHHSIKVQAKVVQVGVDGVGFAFTPAATANATQVLEGAENNAADKKTLDEFIHRWFQASRSKM